MIDTSGFKRISTKKGYHAADSPYVYINPESPTKGAYITLPADTADTFITKFGYECRVLFDEESLTFIVMCGNDRRLVHSGSMGKKGDKGVTRKISVGPAASAIYEVCGRQRRYDLDESWEKDQDGRTVLVLTINGKCDGEAIR